jgi:hypothetical protein
MSQLSQFLREKKGQLELGRQPREIIKIWTTAVERLLVRIRSILEPYTAEGLTMQQWLPLLKEQGVPYNISALTIHFLDYQITVDPKAAPSNGDPGRIEMSCGAKIVWLLWAGGDNWSYKWEYPAYADGPRQLTDQAIEQLVQELLA